MHYYNAILLYFLEFVNALGEPGNNYDENDEDEEDIYPQIEVQE